MKIKVSIKLTMTPVIVLIDTNTLDQDFVMNSCFDVEYLLKLQIQVTTNSPHKFISIATCNPEVLDNKKLLSQIDKMQWKHLTLKLQDQVL